MRELIAEEGNPGLKLRVYITGGGCSGFQYGFEFDEQQGEDDLAIATDGVTLLVDKLPGFARRAMEVAVNLIIAAILAVLLWKSVVWVNSPMVAFEQVITTGWKKWPFFLVVPLFCITAFIHVVAHILRPTGEHHEVTL